MQTCFKNQYKTGEGFDRDNDSYFNESKAEVFGYFPTQQSSGWEYEIMNPNFIDLDNIPDTRVSLSRSVRLFPNAAILGVGI